MDIFGFFPITESRTQDVAAVACNLARAFSAAAADYGPGVRSITATLILTDPTGLGSNHKVEPARYHPGTRIIKAHGVTVGLADELEFSIRPDGAAIFNMKTEAQVANAIADAIPAVRSELETLAIPNFDMQLFVCELEEFFRRIGSSAPSVH